MHTALNFTSHTHIHTNTYTAIQRNTYWPYCPATGTMRMMMNDARKRSHSNVAECKAGKCKKKEWKRKNKKKLTIQRGSS